LLNALEQGRDEREAMTKKTTKSGSISRRRWLATVSAGAALAVSPFRINCCKSGRDAFSL